MDSEMSLRKTTLVIGIVLTMLLLSLINASTHFILLKGIVNLEEKYSLDNIQRAANAIEHEKEGMLTKVNDYAVWDDTFDFMQTRDQAFIDANFFPSVLQNLGINYVIVATPDGEVVYAAGYDLATLQPIPLSPQLNAYLSPAGLFGELARADAGAGILVADGVPLILAYHAVLRSDESGLANGVMVFGRILGGEFAGQMSEITQLALRIEGAQDSTLAAEYGTANPPQSGAQDSKIKILDANTIAVYKLIPDFNGSPAVVVRAVMERDIFNQSYNTILNFIWVVFISSMFTLAVAVYLLDRHVIARIGGLSKSVVNIRLSGDLSGRVPVKGADEIASLGSEMNRMLQSLETAEVELRRSRDDLEQKVEDRTSELTQLNEELTYEISERELGERALFEAYHEIHLILGSITSILIGVDGDDQITQWNHAAASLFGISAAEALGRNFFELPIRCDWAAFTQAVAACKRDDSKIRIDDFILEDPGGNSHILGLTLTSLVEKDKNKPGFLLVGSDITERRLLEQQVGRTNKLEAIGQLAAGVAHEINTPTQLVGSNLRFLGQQIEPILKLIDQSRALSQAVKAGTATREMAAVLERDTAALHLDFIRQEIPKAVAQSLEGIERISKIVSAMRFFMHPGGTTKELANLNKIIENALSLSRNEWKNVAEVTTDLDPDLPAIECMPSDLSQVVLNLLVNAVHAIQDAAGEDENGQGKIGITSRQAGENVEIRISDSGTGIPEAIRAKVFDPFFTTKDVGRGTGQGLSLAYSVIVKKHGGTIEFETEPGKGTTFIIHLPMRAAYDEQNPSG